MQRSLPSTVGQKHPANRAFPTLTKDPEFVFVTSDRCHAGTLAARKNRMIVRDGLRRQLPLLRERTLAKAIALL
jgi:hypothetical protein